MFIDLETGVIMLDGKYPLSRNLLFNEFCTWGLVKNPNQLRLITIKALHRVGDIDVRLGLLFRGAALGCVRFNADYRLSCAESKKANDKWLFSQGVKPGKYSWGSIDSMANESLDISAIIINYD